MVFSIVLYGVCTNIVTYPVSPLLICSTTFSFETV